MLKQKFAGLSRREFLRHSAVAGTAVLLAPALDLQSKAQAAPVYLPGDAGAGRFKSPEEGVSFQLPPESLVRYHKWGALEVVPAELDPDAPDYVHLVVKNYTLANQGLRGRGYILEDCTYKHSNGLKSWLSNLRRAVTSLAPERRFEVVAEEGPSMVVDTSSDGLLRHTAFRAHGAQAFGVTLVGRGVYASKKAVAKGGLLTDMLTVANSLQPFAPAEEAEPAGDVGIEATYNDVYSDIGIYVYREVDWNRPAMTRHYHYCSTPAPWQWRKCLVRAIITDAYGSCFPAPYYENWLINQEFWDGQPANHNWYGNWSNGSVGSQTIFFTFVDLYGAWLCMDHWHPFN